MPIGQTMVTSNTTQAIAPTHVLRGSVHWPEAIEAIARGNRSDSRVVGRSIEQIALPKGATISVIVRGSEVLEAHHDTVVQADDHLILFVTDRRQIQQVERLFRA